MSIQPIEPSRSLWSFGHSASGSSLALLGATALALSGLALQAQEAAPTGAPEEGAAAVVRREKLSVQGDQDADAYRARRTTTATKTDTPLIDVPQSVSVVTRELIEDQAMLSIGDVTRYVPGVGIAQGEGNRDTPVLRGNSTTADFFQDGIRDDVQYIRDLYNVERVEVLKGPNAMIFGRGGSGGLVNRVSKQADGRVHREVSTQVGSWDQYRGTVDVGEAPSASFSYRVTGVFEDSESFRDGFSLKRYGVNPTFRAQLGQQTTVRFGYEYFHDERVADRGVPSFQGRPLATDPSTFFGAPEQSPVEATVDTAFVVLEHRWANGLRFRNHTRYSVYDKFYQNVFPGAVNASATTVALSAYNQGTQRENVFNQTDFEFVARTGAFQHQLLAGLELGRQNTENIRRTGYFDSVSATTTSISVPIGSPQTTLPVAFRPSATDADNAGIAETVGVYLQDQVTLLPQWQAVAGLRYERFSVDFLNRRTGASLASTDEMLSPRAGLIYKPAANLAVYGSYSMSYVPRAGEQLASLTATNRALDPEEFTNQEIGVKWDVRSNLAVTAALYRLERTNVVIADPADATRSLLVDGQKAEGLELGVTGRFTRAWSLTGGYAYQSGEILSTQSATVRAGARLAQLPRHTASLWNRYDLNSRWGVGLGAIYRDSLFASTDNTVQLPSFVRFDAAVFCRVNDQVRVQLNVENVLDCTYFASAHSNNNLTPGSPRAFRLGLTAEF